MPKLGKWFSPAMVLVALAAIVVVILLGTTVYIVDQTEEAVITRFGRYHATQEPGLSSSCPLGLTRCTR